MENSELLSRLMADGQSSSSTSDTESVAVEKVSEQDQDLSLSTARVTAVRYKLLSLIFFVLGVAIILYALLPSWDGLQNVRGQLATQAKVIDDFASKKQGYEKDAEFIKLIQSSELAIADCVNNRVGCANLDPKIKDNFALVRSFLLLSDLRDSKMEVNEKTLLKNINEYLLGKASSSVQNISFGKPELVEGNLYTIPIQLRVEFVNKDKLFAFIDRVDKQIPSSETIRVLYKLDEVSYDIMNYNESQIVDLNLQAFYYQQ